MKGQEHKLVHADTYYNSSTCQLQVKEIKNAKQNSFKCARKQLLNKTNTSHWPCCNHKWFSRGPSPADIPICKQVPGLPLEQKEDLGDLSILISNNHLRFHKLQYSSLTYN